MLKTKQKDLLDKFYTKPDIASFLVKELKNIVDLTRKANEVLLAKISK